MEAERIAIDEELRTLANAFELDEYLLPRRSRRKHEGFAIPRDAGGEIFDGNAEGIVLVPCPWQGHRFPLGIVKLRLVSLFGVADMQAPVRIEIEGGSFGVGDDGADGRQECDETGRSQSWHDGVWVRPARRISGNAPEPAGSQGYS